jgi:predicted transcriptional regulator
VDKSRSALPTDKDLDPSFKGEEMPLLEVVQTRYLSASIRLTDTTAMQVDQYAAFIHATADEVAEQALPYVFSKDRDFQEFLKSAEAQRITPTLRVRRAPMAEPSEQPQKKPRSSAANSAISAPLVGGSRA